VTFHRDAALDLAHLSGFDRAPNRPLERNRQRLCDIAEESANGRGQNPRPFIVLRVWRRCAFSRPNY